MKKNYKLGMGNLILDVVITQEKVKDKTFFVAQGIQIDVASQGLSIKEALENIKDAAEIVVGHSKEAKLKLIEEEQESAPLITRVFI